MTDSQPSKEAREAPRKRKYSLAELVAKISPNNQHPEQDWGEPRGEEVW